MFRELREAFRLFDVWPILRRYFFANAFDGAVTTLGVLISAYLVGLHSPIDVAIPVLGVGVSMFASGFLGSFFTELAERMHEVQKMRESLLDSMDETYYAKAVRIVSLVVGLVDGLSPLIASAIGLLPMLIGIYFGRTFERMFVLSLLAVFAEIFVLGAALGKISGKNPLTHGLLMLLVGFVTGVLVIALAELLGVSPMRACFYSNERTPSMSLRRSVEMFELILSTAVDEKLLEPLNVKKALFVVDDHEKTVEFAKTLRDLALRFGLEIIIARPPGSDLSAFLEILSPYIKIIEDISSKAASRSILSIAEKYSVDFITLTMPYPKVEEGVWGGTLEALISENRYPLLISKNPSSISSVALLIAPNPLTEKPIKRAITMAEKRLDVIALKPDDVRESYCTKLVELLEEKFETNLIKTQSVPQEYDLVVYELKNLGNPIPMEKNFMIVRRF